MIALMKTFKPIELWFLFTCGLFIVQYTRLYPQFLETFRPFVLMSFILVGFIFFSQKRDRFLLKYRQMLIIYASIIWMIITIPISFSYNDAFLTTRSILMLLPFMLSVIHVVTNVDKLKVLVNVIIFATAINVIRGYLLFDGAFRNTQFNIGAFLTDPNDYALYMNMMLPFCYFMFLHEIKWNFKKILYLILSICTIVMIILSYSRGGMIGLVMTGIFILYFSPNKKLTVSIAMIVLCCILAFSGNNWKNAMETTTDMDNSTINHRLDAWDASVKIFIDNPIFGIGPMNISYQVNKYIEKNAKRKHSGNIAHSIWFTALAEGGIIGITLLISLIYANLKNAKLLTKIKPITPELRYLKYFGFACFSSMIAYLTSGTFLTVNYYPHIWYLTAFIIIGMKLFNVGRGKVKCK